MFPAKLRTFQNKIMFFFLSFALIYKDFAGNINQLVASFFLNRVVQIHMCNFKLKIIWQCDNEAFFMQTTKIYTHTH